MPRCFSREQRCVMLSINEENWIVCGRKENCSFADGTIRIKDSFAVSKDTDEKNFELVFLARSPESESKTEIWASFRRYSRDYHYMVGLRGDNHNHLYLSRMGSGGYDKMLAFRPLDFSVMPGTWYRVKIVCAGAKIAVFLEDEKSPRILCEDADAPFSSGSVAFGGGYVYTEYRDISVVSRGEDALDGITEAPGFLQTVTLQKERKEAVRIRDRAMYRSFPVLLTPDARAEFSLEGNWLFIPEKEAGQNPAEPLYDDRHAHTIHVPECWIPLQAWLEGEVFGPDKMNKGQSDSYWLEEFGRCMNYTFDWAETQCAWYRHYLDLPEGIESKNVVADFEGIALESEIYINGVKIRDHIGMFAPFQADLSGYVHAGRNVLAVKVSRVLTEDTLNAPENSIDDNYVKARSTDEDVYYSSDCERRPFNTDDIPHGFYTNHPGGIWRSVKLIIRDRLFIDSCWFRPSTDGAAVEVTVKNSDTRRRTGRICYSLIHSVTGEYLCGGEIGEISLDPEESEVKSFRTPKVIPRLWEPGKPNLYKLLIEISEGDRTLDAYSEKVGFRTVGVSGSRLLFNGKPLWVCGGNHFPAHVKPNNSRLAEKFMEISLDNNVIATRTHAAPWTDVWHNAADEKGVLVSLEGTWPWMMGGHIPCERSMDIWKEELRALYLRHRNRPSLFLITMNNEMNFYLSRGSDDLIREKASHVRGGIKIAREIFPDIPLVCDSGYNRAPTLEKSRDLNFPYAYGRYERVTQKYGFDDGDVDDPHFYYGWYDKDFFHFMNGDFGWRETIPGRPCLLQELSVGYCRDEDGHATRFYLFSHQTPQTTTGKRAYEHNSPAFFQKNHSFQVKGLAETFRRVEHDRVCGMLLFAFETWFYYHCDPLRVQPMLSAKKLKTAYQPVLVCAELYSRHFSAGKELTVPVTVINDDRGRDTLLSPEIELSVEIKGETVVSAVVSLDDIGYFDTLTRSVSVRLPDTVIGDASEAVLKLKATSEGKTVSQNEYDIFIAEEKWANSPEKGIKARCLSDDKKAKSFLRDHGITAEVSNEIPGADETGVRLVIAKQLDAERSKKVYDFACAGGHVIMLDQRDIRKELTGGKEISYIEDATEIITMNAPENSIFNGLREDSLSWFDNGVSVPYAAYGRYNPDRFDKSVCALAETLQWHSYIAKPTDYRLSGGTPLFSVKCGDGIILISSVRTDADGKDPVACRMTDNILTWDFKTVNR